MSFLFPEFSCSHLPASSCLVTLPVLPAWLLANHCFVKIQVTGYGPLSHSSRVPWVSWFQRLSSLKDSNKAVRRLVGCPGNVRVETFSWDLMTTNNGTDQKECLGQEKLGCLPSRVGAGLRQVVHCVMSSSQWGLLHPLSSHHLSPPRLLE